jgi:undecaprenyl-diphosphatase
LPPFFQAPTTRRRNPALTDFLKALILGIVEGLTEFIPVSSTGHLIIASSLLDFTGDQAKVFAIVIQMGAILAVCWLFRERLMWVARGLHNDRRAQKFAINLAVGFMPAAVLGVLLHSTIKTYLFSPLTVAAALVVGGVIILLVESREHKPRVTDIDDMTWRDALKVGFAQTVAMFPGVSRSGATIIGGMLFGLSRQTATLFSFFLAIPTMLGAAVYDGWKNWDLLSVEDLPVFAIGFIAAFFAAFFTVRALIAYIAKHNFRPFAWYRIAFGGLVLLTWQMGWVDWSSV